MRFMWKGHDLYIDDNLAKKLNTLVYNVKNDWDFLILITGNRMVRVGKSVLAFVVAAYLAYQLDRLNLNHDAFSIKNICFSGKTLFTEAQKRRQYSIMMYDEGNEALAKSKHFSNLQRDLIDFFVECGQLNHFFIIVAPDFFDLKEDIAVARSELLINVSVSNTTKMDSKSLGEVYFFKRGRFDLYNRDRKARLYDYFRKRRDKNYKAVYPEFHGVFTNQYPFDEFEYKRLKKDSLERFNARHAADKSKSRRDEALHKALTRLSADGMTNIEIAEAIDYSDKQVGRILNAKAKD